MLRKTGRKSEGHLESGTASMRPQRNAAENKESRVLVWDPEDASMRPQRNAAENISLYVRKPLQYALLQ